MLLEFDIMGDFTINEIVGSELEAEGILSTAPSTRYQGSKRSILPWIYRNVKDLRFQTVLDGFGGTGSVSYLFKLMGKKVTFNDILSSNYHTGIALIENDSVILDEDDLGFLLNKNGFNYPSFIENTFQGFYFLNSENKWLDMITHNIEMLSEKYSGEMLRRKKALAYHILFQCCLRKRPFNLFHRKNLYLRTANVKRSFYNKTTWEKSFKDLFLFSSAEISPKIFSNGLKNKAMCKDIMKINSQKYDLIYLDPPYIKPRSRVRKDYYSLYHFLEGLVDYKNWARKIDWSTTNRRLVKHITGWEKNKIEENFEHIFKTFEDSIIVISYGSPGTPSIHTIKKLLLRYKSKVKIARKEYKYRLSNGNGGKMCEVLIIGE